MLGVFPMMFVVLFFAVMYLRWKDNRGLRKERQRSLKKRLESPLESEAINAVTKGEGKGILRRIEGATSLEKKFGFLDELRGEEAKAFRDMQRATGKVGYNDMRRFWLSSLGQLHLAEAAIRGRSRRAVEEFVASLPAQRGPRHDLPSDVMGWEPLGRVSGNK